MIGGKYAPSKSPRRTLIISIFKVNEIPKTEWGQVLTQIKIAILFLFSGRFYANV